MIESKTLKFKEHLVPFVEAFIFTILEWHAGPRVLAELFRENIEYKPQVKDLIVSDDFVIVPSLNQ